MEGNPIGVCPMALHMQSECAAPKFSCRVVSATGMRNRENGILNCKRKETGKTTIAKKVAGALRIDALTARAAKAWADTLWSAPQWENSTKIAHATARAFLQ